MRDEFIGNSLDSPPSTFFGQKNARKYARKHASAFKGKLVDSEWKLPANSIRRTLGLKKMRKHISWYCPGPCFPKAPLSNFMPDIMSLTLLDCCFCSHPGTNTKKLSGVFHKTGSYMHCIFLIICIVCFNEAKKKMALNL